MSHDGWLKFLDPIVAYLGHKKSKRRDCNNSFEFDSLGGDNGKGVRGTIEEAVRSKRRKNSILQKKYELFSSQIIRQIKSDRQTKAGLVGSTKIN